MRPFERGAVNKPLSLELLAGLKSGTGADVRVRVRAGVVQVESEHASPRAVVPIAATDRDAENNAQPYLILANVYLLMPPIFRFASTFLICLLKPLVPASDHSADFIVHFCPLSVFLYINKS